MSNESRLTFLNRIDGMGNPHHKGSYARFEFVFPDGITGGEIIVSEQQALDLSSLISQAFKQ